MLLEQNSNAKIINLRKIQFGKTRNPRKPKNGYVRENVEEVIMKPFLRIYKKRAKQEYMPFHEANAPTRFIAKTYIKEVKACSKSEV